MHTKLHTVKNGLQVIFVDTEAFPTISTALLVGAGSRYENEKNNGIAHFFEHMAFKGSKKYPNSFTISSTIEALGGVFNAFTSKDHTGYWIKATDEHFSTVIDVLSDMVLQPLLLSEEIEREKGVIVEEINMYEDMPSRRVGEIYEELLYKGHPLGFDIAGTKDTVRSFNRTTFTDYIAQLYHPNNAVLVVAGGLKTGKESEYLSLIEEKFAHWQQAEVGTYIPMKERQQKPALYVRHKPTEQSHFCFGFRTFPYSDPRRYVLSVLATLLGGGMSSRLFMEVRERRGLCYYISTGRESYTDVGNMVSQAGLTNDLGKIKEAMKVIWEQHQEVAQGKITDEEVRKAKEMVKGRLLLSMEDSFSVALFAGVRKLLEDKILSPEEVVQKIESVEKSEIISLAKSIFTSQTLNIALIGPFKSENFDFSFLS